MKVLVADHAGALAPTCIIFLAYWGHDVEVVPDGLAALRKARAWRPDLVLASVGLEGMDGFSLVSALRAGGSLARTAIVLAGTAVNERARGHGQDLGVAAYLETPLAVTDLARVVRQIELSVNPRVERSGAAVLLELRRDRVAAHEHEKGMVMGLKARWGSRRKTAAPAATAPRTNSPPRKKVGVEWKPRPDGSGKALIAYAGTLAARDTVVVRAGTWRQGGEPWAEVQELELTREGSNAWTGVIPIRAGPPVSALEFAFRVGDEWDNGGQAPLGYYEWSAREGQISVRASAITAR